MCICFGHSCSFRLLRPPITALPCVICYRPLALTKVGSVIGLMAELHPSNGLKLEDPRVAICPLVPSLS